jgi:molybdopterin/thiamine biosynthesis adenylyltransferase
MDDLTEWDRAVHEWQMWIADLGEAGQRKLKAARVLITRLGGVGGLVAYQLAAAGVGTLVLAHAGKIKPSDLNRQLLMTAGKIGESRLDCAVSRLKELNPTLNLEAVPENVSASNAEPLVSRVDLVVSCVPRFEERLALNAAAVQQGKPLIDGGMYELSGQLTSILPGKTACIACRVPYPPPSWKREFPVLGAVAGTVGCLAAMEAIKIICGIGEPLWNRLLLFDLREMRFRTMKTERNPHCAVCGKS